MSTAVAIALGSAALGLFVTFLCVLLSLSMSRKKAAAAARQDRGQP